MYKSFVAALLCLLLTSSIYAQEAEEITERRITVSEFKDKMMGGWIGQMVGVGWGASTEFAWQDEMIPDEDVPEWHPEMVNVWGQDDLYVEMTFLRTLEEYGLDVSIHQAGLDFANSKYLLWHANNGGRSNLREGIAPPDCSHPQYSEHGDDIDYQIEADYSGLISPGMPNAVIVLGEKFGRLVNYGDGLYAGQFVGAMYAEAFFETDPHKILLAGLASIPSESQYAEMVNDVIQWHSEAPDDWRATWQKISDKYHHNPEYRQWSCHGPDGRLNIDAKVNGAYIVVGMLYGKNLDEVMRISMQCGDDSDCNPSNAGGVLATAVGYKNLPDKYVSGLEEDEKFSYTEYDFPALIDVCMKLARDQIVAAGGRVETNEEGEEIFVIPVQKPVPSEFVKSWEPGPIAGTEYTGEELPHLPWLRTVQIAFWAVLVLAIVALPENRNWKALMILIPVALAYLIWDLAERHVPEVAIDYLDHYRGIFITQAVGFAILFLLGERLAKFNGLILSLLAVIILIAVSLLGTFAHANSYYQDWVSPFFSKYFVSAGILILSLYIVSKILRKKYSNLRFAFLLLVTIIITQFILVGLFITIFWAPHMLFSYTSYFLNVGFGSTVLLYMVTLPFWILAFSNETFNHRLKASLRIPDETNPEILDNDNGKESNE